MKTNSFSWKKIMSYRREVFGILALWIVFYHVYMFNWIPRSNIVFTVASYFIGKGRCGVDLFLFLSAIGLNFSMSKNDTKTFYINRLKKIVPCYLICVIPYFIWYDLIYKSGGGIQLLLNVSSLNYWIVGNDFPLWFVSFILAAYLVYPLIHKADKKTKHISTIVIMAIFIALEWFLYLSENPMFEKYELSLSRIPIFLFGVLVVKWVNSDREIKIPEICLVFLLAIASYYFSMKTEHLILRRYSEGIFCICLMMIYAFIRNFGILNILGSIFSFLGGISLEIYMVHVLIFFKFWNSFDNWDCLPWPLWYIIVPVVSIPIAKLVSVSANKIIMCIEKKNKKTLTQN